MLQKSVSIIVVFTLIISQAVAQKKMLLAEKSSVVVKGTSTLHDWEVSSTAVSGSLDFEPKGRVKKQQSMRGVVTTGALTLKTQSLISENGDTMNGKMHRALKYEEYPTIDFRLTQLIKVSQNAEQTVALLVGTLKIAGVERIVEINTIVTSTAEYVFIKGSESIQLSDFKIEPPSAMFGQIITGNDVEIFFDLKFKQ